MEAERRAAELKAGMAAGIGVMMPFIPGSPAGRRDYDW
jgi:hypothetical protein